MSDKIEKLREQVTALLGSSDLAESVIENTLRLDTDFLEKNSDQLKYENLLVIKSCPFCGGPPCVEVKQDEFWAEQFPDDDPTYKAHVWCHECGAKGSVPDSIFDNCEIYDKEKTARKAVERWNQRENTFSGETARLFSIGRDC